MNNFLNPETFALNIATLGILGKHPVGRFLSPLLAVPIVFLGRHVYLYSKDLFYVPLLVAVICVIWVVDFAFDNLPLERTEQIVLPMIPGMAEALMHLSLTPKIILGSFIIFWLVNLIFEKIIEKLTDDPTEGSGVEEELFDEEEDEDAEKIGAYVLPPNKQKTLYEILMLPIGAGVVTSFIMHMILLVAKRL